MPADESRMPKAKSTALKRIQFQDYEGNWRTKVVANTEKFDDELKAIFLEAYKDHARMTDAARVAGVSLRTVRKHLETDEVFAEEMMNAQQMYRDRLISHHQALVFDGTEKVSYDRNGNIVSKEIVYPIRLIELELKKHDEGYREKRDVNMSVSGGVLVAPPDVKSIDDWESKFANAPVIENEEPKEKDEE